MKFLDVELMENRKGNYSKSIKALSQSFFYAPHLFPFRSLEGWKKFSRAVSEASAKKKPESWN
jgi:hypothetical protein